MPRLFRRSSNGEATDNTTDDSTKNGGSPRRGRARKTAAAAGPPARKTPARKTAGARKAAAAESESAAKPARSRGSRGGRGRRTGGNGAATAEPAAAAPATEPSAGVAEGEILQMFRRQAELIEQQTQLLQTLVGTHDADGGASTVAIKPRLALFVDVPNILYAAERSGVTVDWVKVQRFLSRGRTLVRSLAYAPVSDDPASRREMERFVLPFLDKDYRIVTKPLKRFSGGSVKANFDVELAIDILTMADRLDVIGLVSGDGDFRRLIEIVSARGVRVEVCAFGHSTSHDLREVADRYIDIAAYVPELCETK